MHAGAPAALQLFAHASKPGMRDMFVATDDSGELQRSSAEFYSDASYTESNREQRV